jgi:hypothetical protein
MTSLLAAPRSRKPILKFRTGLRMSSSSSWNIFDYLSNRMVAYCGGMYLVWVGSQIYSQIAKQVRPAGAKSAAPIRVVITASQQGRPPKAIDQRAMVQQWPRLRGPEFGSGVAFGRSLWGGVAAPSERSHRRPGRRLYAASWPISQPGWFSEQLQPERLPSPSTPRSIPAIKYGKPW